MQAITSLTGCSKAMAHRARRWCGLGERAQPDRHGRLRGNGLRSAGRRQGRRRRRDRGRSSQVRRRAAAGGCAGQSQPARRKRERPRTAISRRSAWPSCWRRGRPHVARSAAIFADRAEPDLLALLDLVALGTVADVAAAARAEPRIRGAGAQGHGGGANVGMAALIDASRLNRAPTCSDLGFALGPRINAGGRVGESDLGVRLLTTEDPDEARDIAPSSTGSTKNAADRGRGAGSRPRRRSKPA